MYKLIELFNRLGIDNDKVMHAICGAIITLAVGVVFSPDAGLVLGLVAGGLKELYDLLDYGLWDFRDMFATWAGALAGFAALFII